MTTRQRGELLRARAGSSVREVRLVGPLPRPTWEPAEEVEWSGRVYRVEATQDANPGQGPSGPDYAHLAPVSQDNPG